MQLGRLAKTSALVGASSIPDNSRRVTKPGQQLVNVNRLQKEALRAERGGAGEPFTLVRRGEDRDGDGTVFNANLLKEIQAISVGQQHVEQDCCGVSVELTDCVGERGGNGYVVTVQRQDLF